MKLKINNIIDKYTNKDMSCVIVGSGHTMNEFDYKNFNGKIIFCGTSILRMDHVSPDFLISCNNHFPVININSHLEYLNRYPKMTWIFSDTGCYNDIWNFDKEIFKKLKPNYLMFDDRHFNQKKCKPEKNCCKFLSINKNRKTIHEIVEEKYNYKYPLNNKRGISVAEIALMFAILMGFKKIYIQGVDLPTKNYKSKSINNKYYGYQAEIADKILDEALRICRKKYFFYYLSNLNFLPYLISLKRRINLLFNNDYSDFSKDINLSLEIFSWLASIAKSKNVKIFNLSKNSNLNHVKNINFISLK